MPNPTLPLTRTLLAAFCLIMGPIASADLLVLKNGDRITGDIKAIWDNEITIEPTYSDEFDVDAEVVAHIESERAFDIELSDGREFAAVLKGANEEGLQVYEIDGEEIAAPLAQLYELDEIDDPVEWDSYVDWSMAVNSGNTNSLNTKLAANTTLTIGDHRHYGDLTVIREEQDSLSTKEQDLVRYNYNWLFNDPWFFSAAMSLERDPIRELDGRAILTAGMGRDIWNTPRLTLNIQLGAGVITEEIEMSNDQSTVVAWTLRYRQDLFAEDLEIYHNNSITYYLSGRANTIYKTTTGLRYEITDLLYANFSVDYDYETQPAATATNEDLAVLFGLGVEF
jgi:putative salt-induced outer membrane protein YdiY